MDCVREKVVRAEVMVESWSSQCMGTLAFFLNNVGSFEMTRVLTGPHSSGYYVDLELLGARAETGPWLYHGCVVCANPGKWAEVVSGGHGPQGCGSFAGFASRLCHITC